jgi:hypothetical protein
LTLYRVASPVVERPTRAGEFSSQQSRREERHHHPQGDANQDVPQPASHHQPKNAASLRAERKTDANLALLLRDRVGNQTVRNRTYYVLIERLSSAGAPISGLGTYVYNPSACRSLSIQAPHAGGDENTLPEAVTLSAELNATALLVAGTHQCANTTESTCDGTSTVCNSRNSKFVISDVAHFTLNYCEPAHEEILKTIPNLITVAIHGEGEHNPGRDHQQRHMLHLSVAERGLFARGPVQSDVPAVRIRFAGGNLTSGNVATSFRTVR